ncbi:hypothetical protein [Gilliamella sp. GillExp13]|uniref:hypothetical protein n=1 Tax=Gilliamella sp. GillExp13 TaxID=3120243 RepID=UPI000A5D3670|nr:hypothetical protein [Gilliamella apicola]
MAFTETERQQLMELKFVGAKIIEILNKGALLTGSTCWKNSHQAKTVISNILSLVNNT